MLLPPSTEYAVEAQSGADGQRKQRLRVKRHKDMFRNEDRDMNEGIHKVRRRRKPMLKEHLNGTKKQKMCPIAPSSFPLGMGY
jgi:hypothetical protein